MEQTDSGVISCRNVPLDRPGVRRRLECTGLKDATIRFFPEPGSEDSLKFVANHRAELEKRFIDFKVEETPYGKCITLRNMSDSVIAFWS